MGAKIKKIIIYVIVVMVLFVNETLVYATKEEYYNKAIAEKDKANFYNLTMDEDVYKRQAFTFTHKFASKKLFAYLYIVLKILK